MLIPPRPLFLLLAVCLGVIWAEEAPAQGSGEVTLGPPRVREHHPVLSADGAQLFFARPDHRLNQGKQQNPADVWVRTRGADGRWSIPINPGSPINSFGADRPLALSPAADRLAVLREGARGRIDVLARTGRNWLVTASYPLPPGPAAAADLTFNPLTYELIYAAPSPAGDLDLYRRRITATGDWGPAEALHRLSSPADETTPRLAADGRTLYFRSNGRWMLRPDAGQAARLTRLDGHYRELAAPLDPRFPAVVTLEEDGERLAEVPLPAGAAPAPAQLVTGFLPTPPAPGEAFADIPVNAAVQLRVRPDRAQRYTLLLREGERLFPAGQLPAVPAGGQPTGGLASSTSAELRTRRRLEQRIVYQERELARLDSLRRASAPAEPNFADPAYRALRQEVIRRNELLGDTLPPRPTNSTRARYADDLSELERMKAKFRRQQQEKLTGRRPATPAPAAPTPDYQHAPYGQPAPYEQPTPYGQPTPHPAAYADSLRIQQEVNNGLYRTHRPPVNRTEAWESNLRRDLPQQRPLDEAERARLDREYERQMAELAEMREQLRRSRGQEADRQWQARSVEAPSTYRQPAPATGEYYPSTAPAPRPPYEPAYPHRPAASSGLPAGVTFIPNTAYPNSAGYAALDELARLVQYSETIVEIRVHVAPQLDPRSAQILSEERAAAIRDHLVAAGVSPAHFRAIGYGNHLTGNGGERVEVLR